MPFKEPPIKMRTKNNQPSRFVFRMEFQSELDFGGLERALPGNQNVLMKSNPPRRRKVKMIIGLSNTPLAIHDLATWPRCFNDRDEIISIGPWDDLRVTDMAAIEGILSYCAPLNKILLERQSLISQCAWGYGNHNSNSWGEDQLSRIAFRVINKKAKHVGELRTLY